MQKYGRAASGRQRWRCRACKLSMVAGNGGARRVRELESFVSWLRSGRTQEECGGRGFRKRVAWCWQVEPLMELPATRRHVLMADGTYISHGHCLLVLMDGVTGKVARFRWCAHETIAAYRALLHGVPAPDVLAGDGMRGMETAARAEWPDTRLQRCLAHVQRDTRRDLTMHPGSQAGRELRKLSLKPARVRTAEQAAQWAEALNAWHERWRGLVSERTTAKQDPGNPKALAGRKWWWTHERLRRSYKRFEKLFRDGRLFAYLDPRLLEGGPVPDTTNRLEGGVNSPIKRILVNHRGMGEARMMRACEYECFMRIPGPDLKALLEAHETRERTRASAKAQQERESEQHTGDEPTAGSGVDWNELHASTPYPNNTD